MLVWTLTTRHSVRIIYLRSLKRADLVVATLAATGLINEIEQSTPISELVVAVTPLLIKPRSKIDVHEASRTRWLFFAYKLKKGVIVTREYDRTFAPNHAYGSELNPGVDKLIDNAIDAMAGKGQIWILTSRREHRILAEIADNGSGIPPALSHLWAIFTTKGVGEGTKWIGFRYCLPDYC